MTKKKSLYLGYALALFLGGVGAHLFYYKKFIRAIFYLLFSWTFIPIILGWIDMIFVKKWNNQLYTRKNELANSQFSKTYNNKTSILSKEHNSDKLKHTNESEFVKLPKTSIKSNQNDNKQPTVINKSNRQKRATTEKKSVYSSMNFYSEEDIILDKYEHLKTPQSILDSLREIKNQNSDTYEDNEYGLRVTISTSMDDFAKQSMKYANTDGKPAREIPFQEYWPDFSSLDKEQLKWYLYWRGQTLRGNYIEVDLSYIFIFVYELLFYTFNKKASFNVSMLVRLRNAYLEDHPKLDNYLPRWIVDMLYELDERELTEEWTEQKKEIPKLYQIMELKPLSEISITDWKPFIINYKETKFFHAHKNYIYKVFKESVEILDEFLQQQGTTLREKGFVEKRRRQIRQLYTGIIISRETVDVHEYYFSVIPTQYFKDVITQLFRLSENVARKEKGEIREIKVDEEILPEGMKELMLNRKGRFKQVLKRSEKQGSAIPLPSENYELADKKSEIRLPQVDRFITDKKKKELEEVQFLIENEMKTEVDQEKQLVEETFKGSATFTSIDNTKEKDKAVKEDMIMDIENDVDIDGFWEEIKPAELNFLKLLLEGDGEFSKNEAASYLKQQGEMLGVLVNEINEKAVEYLGENILRETNAKIIVDEEFRYLFEIVKEV